MAAVTEGNEKASLADLEAMIARGEAEGDPFSARVLRPFLNVVQDMQRNGGFGREQMDRVVRETCTCAIAVMSDHLEDLIEKQAAKRELRTLFLVTGAMVLGIALGVLLRYPLFGSF